MQDQKPNLLSHNFTFSECNPEISILPIFSSIGELDTTLASSF